MRYGVALLSLVLSAGTALAADVLPPVTPAPPVYKPLPAFNWSGFYIGAMGGYGWSDRVTVAGQAFTGAGIKGGFGGGTVGFNYQAPGSLFVVGAEADAAWSDIKRSDAIGFAVGTEKVKTFGSVTGRVGVAVDTVLIYGKGGYAWAENQLALTVLGVTLSESHFHSGWTGGGGVEWAFAGPWSAKAEYMYARYNSQNYFAGIAPPGVGLGLDVQTVKVGINYRFGWSGPVVAKY